jgi:Flp pilus assembly protein TadG
MRPRRLRGDDGAATTELVLVAPALLIFILLIVQAALWFHATSVASSAAQDGAHDASLLDATVEEGEQTAQRLLDTLADGLILNTAVGGQVVDDGDRVRMTVTGDIVSVLAIPGVDLSVSVHEVAETPVEQFRPGAAATP